mmetsp:Transcript_33471/g.87834  ORF Transcript_33471/g.87834 Transcript_33471/m.87834 type:complete len:241 (+) Transcript_33471:2088-2810(+)
MASILWHTAVQLNEVLPLQPPSHSGWQGEHRVPAASSVGKRIEVHDVQFAAPPSLQLLHVGWHGRQTVPSAYQPVPHSATHSPNRKKSEQPWSSSPDPEPYPLHCVGSGPLQPTAHMPWQGSQIPSTLVKCNAGHSAAHVWLCRTNLQSRHASGPGPEQLAHTEAHSTHLVTSSVACVDIVSFAIATYSDGPHPSTQRPSERKCRGPQASHTCADAHAVQVVGHGAHSRPIGYVPSGHIT